MFLWISKHTLLKLHSCTLRVYLIGWKWINIVEPMSRTFHIWYFYLMIVFYLWISNTFSYIALCRKIWVIVLHYCTFVWCFSSNSLLNTYTITVCDKVFSIVLSNYLAKTIIIHNLISFSSWIIFITSCFETSF